MNTLAVQTPEELALQVLEFSLPDPNDKTVSATEFDLQIDYAWNVCDRFDLQTDVWRGRILRTVRDRELATEGGHFEAWLREREITKSRAYRLIELAEASDVFLKANDLDQKSMNRFSKAAFVEAANAPEEIQTVVVDAALSGKRVTKREVQRLSDEWMALTSDTLPEETRERISQAHIPTRYVASAVRELEKLSPEERIFFTEEIEANPDADTLKRVTSEARSVGRYLDDARRVQCLGDEVNAQEALGEAARIGKLAQTAELLKLAYRVESTISQLHTAWNKLCTVHDQLDAESGASTRHLRDLLSKVKPLTSDTPSVELGKLRIGAQISTESRWDS
jgi:hypothetical protein